MAYVIGPACIDELNSSCADACPVDCIYEGARRRYIQPDECIQCGACVPACPVAAITTEAAADRSWAEDNARFFSGPLTGHPEPLGSPGGAGALGRVGVDTQMTSQIPACPADDTQEQPS